MRNYLPLIQYFHCAIAGKSEKVNQVELNRAAMERGYLVDERVCNVDVRDFLYHEYTNYNATFWKEWDDVLSRSQFELYLYQALHYMSTYGTDFTTEPFVPNDMNGDVPDIKNFKFISYVTDEEMFDKCWNILTSGIALKGDTMTALSSYVMDYSKEYKVTLCVDDIKNKEARCYICRELGILPKDPVELLRTLVYMYIGTTLLIKDKHTIEGIKTVSKRLNDIPNRLGSQILTLNGVTEEVLISLATIFYRFKPIFLAMRSIKWNRAAINKIRRYAKTMHTPMKQGFWQTVLTEEKNVSDIKSRLNQLTTYKKLALMQTCVEHVICDANLDESYKAYIIRNGKLFVKPRELNSNVRMEYYGLVYSILKESVVETMKKNVADGGAYKLPSNLTLTVPTSEKNFIGNYPIGTHIEGSGATTIGIYWRNEWGTHDFDLSMFDVNGKRYGWCYAHKSEEGTPQVLYSGDMTNAEPEATELMYCEKGMPNSLMRVNRYNGKEGSKFKVFLASSKIPNATNGSFKGYMCDPNEVIAEAECISTSCEQAVGAYINGTFYFTDLKTGNCCVATSDPNAMLSALYNRLRSSIGLEELLQACGMHQAEGDEEVALDLTDVTKDKIINLFVEKKEDK